MKCSTVKLPGGGVAIVCGSRQAKKHCKKCGAASTVLCDFKATPESKTCDKPLCRRCAVNVGPDLDHCPDHPRAADLLSAL